MIGYHMSITPNLLTNIKKTYNMGSNAIQIFLGNNRTISIKSKLQLSEKESLQIKDYLLQNKIYLAIHSIYLLNFCNYSPLNPKMKISLNNIIYDFKIAENIGASTIVLHLGNQKQLDINTALNNMIDNIIYILKETILIAPNVSLSLETPAGQGTQICTTIDELLELIELIHKKLNDMKKTKEITKSEMILIFKRLKICIDTAHIFSAGHDIRSIPKIKSYLNKYKKYKSHIELIHLNDSKKELNSRRDLHEGIGDGFIFNSLDGKKALQYLIKWTKNNNIPIILETHKAGGDNNPLTYLYHQEVSFLNSIIHLNDKDLSKWKLQHKQIKSKSTQKKRILNIGLLTKVKEIINYYNNYTDDKIRLRAYNNAYIALMNYPEEIKSGDQVSHLPGIGKQMIKKINEYITTGEMEIFTKLINPELKKRKKNEMPKILGFGKKKLELLKSKHKLDNIKDIILAYKNKTIKLNNKEKLGLLYYKDLNKLLPRQKSLEIFNYIKEKVQTILKKYKDITIEIAGSYPSGKKYSKDVDILIFSNKTDYTKIIKEIIPLFTNDELKIYQTGDTKLLGIFIIKNHAYHVDIRILPNDSKITGRLYFTSGKDFNIMIRQYALKKGYLLNEYGLYNRFTKEKIHVTKEIDIFNILGLNYIPMEHRRSS